MSFTCKNGPVHQHDTVEQSKICWGLIIPPRPTVTPTFTPPPVDWTIWYPKDGHRPRRPEGMSSWAQIDYISDLGGDVLRAYSMTGGRGGTASRYIDQLRAQLKTKPKESSVESDPRLDLIKGMLDMIPDGYYAVQEYEGAHIHFLRIKRPPVNTKTYGGALKVQTQHGPRLELEAVLWPSGKWSIYKHGVIPQLMLLVPDHQGAAMRYAKKLNHCMRCNTELTDPRSRHYGIGPECEQKNGWGWVIPSVDDSNEGHSFEWLLARGMIDVSVV